MRTFVLMAAAVATLGSVNFANAMPLGPLSATDTAAVIQIAGGCGRGWAPDPMGRCRPMGRAVVVAPPVVVVPPVVVRRGPVCPPGMFFRRGRCRPF